MTETTQDTMEGIRHIADTLPPLPMKKDRSNGGINRIKPAQKGEVRNPKGNPEHNPGAYSMRKVRTLYAREGFSPEDVARRMTGWLSMPYGKAKKKLEDDKTQLFERLGISIIIGATEHGDTSKLNTLLDRIIGPVIQHTSADIRTLSVTAKADVDLLTRIQTDMQSGKLIVNNVDQITD